MKAVPYVLSTTWLCIAPSYCQFCSFDWLLGSQSAVTSTAFLFSLTTHANWYIVQSQRHINSYRYQLIHHYCNQIHCLFIALIAVLLVKRKTGTFRFQIGLSKRGKVWETSCKSLLYNVPVTAARVQVGSKSINSSWNDSTSEIDFSPVILANFILVLLYLRLLWQCI